MIKTFTQLLLLINFLYMPLVNADATTSDLIFKHSYKLISSKIHFADSVNILYKDNQDEYTFEVSSRTAGIFKAKKDIRNEISKFRKISDSIFPQEYYFNREKKESNEQYKTFINPKDNISKTVISKDNKVDTITHPHIIDVQDRLTVQLDYINKMKTADFDQTYTVIDKGRVREYTFSLYATEDIDTIFGNTSTVVVKRAIKNNKRSTLTWYALDYDFVPVKIEQYRKDKLKFTAIITDVEN